MSEQQHGSVSALEHSRGYVKRLMALLQELDHEAVARVIAAFEKARQEKRRIYFIGNGGSASTCGHFVNDLHAGSLRHGGGGFRAQDLTANVASLTALANDIGYENVFSSQLEKVVDAGDLLVAISASGNSKNLVKAVEYAREQGMLTIGLLGFDGGVLNRVCDMAIVIRTPQGEYGPVEDIHMVLDHLIGSYFCR